MVTIDIKLQTLETIFKMRKINNIIYHLYQDDDKKIFLGIDKTPKSNKNFTDDKKIFIIKSVFNNFTTPKLIRYVNNYFLFELEGESSNANN